MADIKKRKIWDFLIMLAIVYLLVELVSRFFFAPQQKNPDLPLVTLTPQTASVRVGNNPVIVVQNNRVAPLVLASRCPNLPLDLFRVTIQNGVETLVPVEVNTEPVACSSDLVTIESNAKATIDLGNWKYTLFMEPATYQVQLPTASGAMVGSGALQPIVQTRFSVVELGFFTKLFRAIITKPFLNFLVLTASFLPGHNLGVGIILLTLLVKILLYIPTQHAMEGQKKMQLLQPKIKELQLQYKGDPQALNRETMKLWKENHVNPLQSCLPLLVQFPVLIGLFYVIRDSSSLVLSHHLLYPFFSGVTWDFGHQFLGFNLTQPSVYIFPPILVILQFFQMKLSFAIADRKKQKQVEKAEAGGVMESQQKIMLYVLPFMIGFFALKFPAAVSLYWGISTLFAIGQQIVVNREHLRV